MELRAVVGQALHERLEAVEREPLLAGQVTQLAHHVHDRLRRLDPQAEVVQVLVEPAIKDTCV